MSRSNRQLTQFAVDRLLDYLNNGNAFQPGTTGNTGAAVNRLGDYEILTFTLHGVKILEVFFDHQTCSHVVIHDGGFHDALGRPSRTTRERLNGLLDELGNQCLLPEQVRVFSVIKEDGQIQCVVGRGRQVEPLGAGFSSVTLIAHPFSVKFYHEF